MSSQTETWRIEALDLRLEVTLPEPGSFLTDEERDENRGLWFLVTCFLRYPEPYYADELIETVLQIHEAVMGYRLELNGDTHDDYVWDRIYSNMEFAAVSGAFRLKEYKPEPLPVLDELPEINYTPQPIVPERTTYIGVVVKDQDGEFVPHTRVRIKLPDGDEFVRETNKDGEVMIKGFVIDGMAEIELLDFVDPLDGEAEDEEAVEEEATEEEVPPVADVTEEKKEFTVKVVDETGKKGIEGVLLVFHGAGTSEKVPTDSSGTAKWKAAADSVEVTFDDVADVNKKMKKLWQSRPATKEGDYAAASSEIVPVVSRAAAVETPDGATCDAVSVDATQPKTLSIRPAKKRALIIEMHDTLFRNDSAVVNPEGEAPASTVGEHESLTTVGLIATVLRYNEEHEGKKLFIAGHTDRAGDEKDNVKLSEHRANAVLALVAGKKSDYVAACKAKHSEVDVTQLMDWANTQYGFSCKPTVMDRPPSDENYYLFRKSYNAWVKGPVDTANGEIGPRGAKIGDTGRVQDDIWEGMFDLYEHNLRQELGEETSGVEALRGKLNWVDGGKKTVGFGEKHPTAANTVDGMRSQADRRVEVMLFDEEDVPDLAASNGEDVYDGVTYQKKRVEAALSVKRQVRLSVEVGRDNCWKDEDWLVVTDSDGTVVFERQLLQGELLGSRRQFIFDRYNVGHRYRGEIRFGDRRFRIFGYTDFLSESTTPAVSPSSAESVLALYLQESAGMETV